MVSFRAIRRRRVEDKVEGIVLLPSVIAQEDTGVQEVVRPLEGAA